MQTSSEQNANVKPEGRDDWHFIVLALIEGGFIGLNFLGMLFRALQIKSKVLCMQIIPSLLIMIQVPLFPVLLGFVMFSIGFLFIHRKVDVNKSKRMNILIKIHVVYVLYFIVMFTYWGITAMSLPQPR